MPSFKGRDGQIHFHPNPQVARSIGSPPANTKEPGKIPNEENLEERDSPGIHERVADAADHVEIHHGAHPDGQPPDDGTHAYHVIIHKRPQGGEGMGVGPGDKPNPPEIHNHPDYDSVESDVRDQMDTDQGDENADTETSPETSDSGGGSSEE